MLWMLFSSFASALHLPPPFARFYFDSSAAPADRDLGSEDGGRHVPGLGTIRYQPTELDLLDVYTSQCRLGEASNPGPNTLPPMLLTVGTSNPGGLRRKEEIILDRGPGLWTLTETQLSFATMRTSAGVFRSLGNSLNRAIRPLFSSEAPLRPGSSWAGAWSGVATISDYPAAQLQLPWPDGHWSSARVLLTRHWAQGTPVLVGGFYGFTQGPTWPHARQQNEDLLQTFTTQVVIGMSGVRIIQGDFNFDPRELHQHMIWEQYGWRNAQNVAQELLDHTCVPTCKNSTQRDQIWLSPEAIFLMRGIQVTHDFVDHATVSVQLAIPSTPHMIHTWPRPSKIPKHDFMDSIPDADEVLHYDTTMDSTDFFHRFSEAYENECSAQHVAATGKPLPAQCKGRGQRLQPLAQQPFTPCCSPSREGEVQPESSVIGSATKHWFKQLRRVQSLVHAVKAASMTPSAIAHRAELWTAIVHARGFTTDFRSWWSSRVPKIDGSPRVLPQGPPAEGAEAHLLYEEFLQHYRTFERWHLQQRTMSLRAKYDGSLQALYNDLRDQPRNGVDLLWQEKRYAILAIHHNSGQMQLDNPVDTFDFVCLHDDCYVQITNVEHDTCTVSPCDALQPGDELVQRIFMHDVHDMHRTFRDHWTSRWNLLSEISDTDWQRITAFASSFLPRHPFQVEQLTLSSWKKTCSKFKPRSARGPDGYDRDDMLRVPAHLTEGYLNMMSHIEDAEAEWPKQITQGMVIGLAKHDQAHEPGHFRPITLFSMWYRAWARLRTKEIIHQMCHWIPAEALGFLPHRETTEIWMVLQAHIETMLTTGHNICGMSTDLQRAFNCIGRRQVFMIAERLGIPGRLLNPWKRFLQTFTRRFEIRGTVGPPMASTSGFPEGCPLSIVAMLCVNWSYHIYMKAFAPGVTAYSFVDNLTLASLDPALVARAFFALRCICQLFGLSTDDSKTYVWGTTTRARKLLSQLGFICLLDASELGGSMTFGAALRNRELRKRGDGLSGKWARLKRSMAPLPQKLTILPKVFWPKALYGSMNCLISDQYVHGLRTQATKALKLNGAGSNSLLRLSLSDDMSNDPGFSQLRLCLLTFQRMLRKSDDLVFLWKVRMECFDGSLKPGPFSRLLQCLAAIGWSVLDPPWIHDHEQRTWNLELLDETTLQMFLQDAWLQYVASTLKRKTMRDLRGIDGALTLWNTKKMLPLHRSLLSALHSGAFLSANEQSRFDDEKTAFCTLCGCEDDRQHWLLCPRFANLRANIPGWHVDNCELPDCLVNHLLVPRLPLAIQWRRALWSLEDCTQNFCLHNPPNELNHLFTDGSCTTWAHADLTLASWAVVNATTCDVVAMGPLHGLVQSIGRAEASAILAGLRWALFHAADVCIWSDSLSSINLVRFIQEHDRVPSRVSNYDIWKEIHEVLRSCAGLCIFFQWVPSHLELSQLESPLEDWAASWNDVADTFAGMANRIRSPTFWQLWQRYRLSLDWWSERIAQLREFFFAIAAGDDKSPPVIWIEDDPVEEAVETLEDQLPVNWHALCREHEISLPADFITNLVLWIIAAEALDGTVRTITEVELVFALKLDGSFSFPLVTEKGKLVLRQPAWCYFQPTLSQLLRPVQQALRRLQQLFPNIPLCQTPFSKPEIGLYKKFSGVRIHLTDDLYQSIQEGVKRFTLGRPVRRTCDLARQA